VPWPKKRHPAHGVPPRESALAVAAAHVFWVVMKRLAAVLFSALLSFLAGQVLAQPAPTLPPITTITFAPGSPLSTVTGQMVVGCCDLYSVPAKAGQTMLVSVVAEGEVTFRVYGPDTTIGKTADGQPLIQGKALPDAGPDDNAKAWVGALPRSGNYVIAVAMADKGPVVSPYSLTVSLQ